jgi:hypothetical protein
VEAPRGVAGRAEGKGAAEAPRVVAGRAEGKSQAAGDGAGVVAAPAPKAGTAEPGPREEGPASRPKPEKAIGAAGSPSSKTLPGGARRRRGGVESGRSVERRRELGEAARRVRQGRVTRRVYLSVAGTRGK